MQAWTVRNASSTASTSEPQLAHPSHRVLDVSHLVSGIYVYVRRLSLQVASPCSLVDAWFSLRSTSGPGGACAWDKSAQLPAEHAHGPGSSTMSSPSSSRQQCASFAVLTPHSD